MALVSVDHKWLKTVAIEYKPDEQDAFIEEVREFHYGHPLEIFRGTTNPLLLLLLTQDGRQLRAEPGSWFVVDAERGAWIMSGPLFDTFYGVKEPD